MSTIYVNTILPTGATSVYVSNVSIDGPGSNNMVIGSQTSLATITSGAQNISVGYGNLLSNTSGSDNIGLGSGTLPSNTTGTKNIGLGTFALQSSTIGSHNIAVGYEAAKTLVTANRNIAIGTGSLRSSTTSQNSVAIGYNAMYASTTGPSGSVAIGYQAYFNGTGSIPTVAIGKDSLLLATTGGGNVAVGNESGKNLTTGNVNVLVGHFCGSALTTGSNNVFVGSSVAGFNSGDQFVGNNCISIGSGSSPSMLDVDNEITLGNDLISVLRCQVTSITSLSDKRDKTNIENSSYGLELVKSLKPVTFEWDTRDGAKKGIKDLGFIAQDLKEVDDTYLKLVYESNPDKLEASYGRLIPVLVKAIQDLSKELDELKNK